MARTRAAKPASIPFVLGLLTLPALNRLLAPGNDRSDSQLQAPQANAGDRGTPGLYLARGAVASAYGAAGSLIVVVLWVYYSAQILLLGAEVARALDAPQRSRERAGAGSAEVAQARAA